MGFTYDERKEERKVIFSNCHEDKKSNKIEKNS